MQNARDRLEAATHVPATGAGNSRDRMDARVKPAHDDLRLVPLKTRNPLGFPGHPARSRECRGGDPDPDRRPRVYLRDLMRAVGAAIAVSDGAVAPPRIAGDRAEVPAVVLVRDQ
jgi:hypothetical protein